MKKALMIVLSLLFSGSALASITYKIELPPYDEFSVFGDYEAGMVFSGQFTVSRAFPPNTVVQIIGSAPESPPGLITIKPLNYSFTDGINSYNQSNSGEFLDSVLSSYVVTDEFGEIISLIFNLQTPRSTDTGIGDPVDYFVLNMDQFSYSFAAFDGLVCTEVTDELCSNLTEGEQFGFAGASGAASIPNQFISIEFPPIPSLSGLGLALLAVSLLILGWRFRAA